MGNDVTRCEPPRELRGVDGWHWIEPVDQSQTPWMLRWEPAFEEWRDEDGTDPGLVESFWRYHSTVSTPAEVEALRAERQDWKRQAEHMHALADRREMERDDHRAKLTTLRARVAQLEGSLQDIAAIDPIGINMGTGAIGWGEPPRATVIARAALEVKP